MKKELLIPLFIVLVGLGFSLDTKAIDASTDSRFRFRPENFQFFNVTDGIVSTLGNIQPSAAVCRDLDHQIDRILGEIIDKDKLDELPLLDWQIRELRNDRPFRPRKVFAMMMKNRAEYTIEKIMILGYAGRLVPQGQTQRREGALPPASFSRINEEKFQRVIRILDDFTTDNNTAVVGALNRLADRIDVDDPAVRSRLDFNEVDEFVISHINTWQAVNADNSRNGSRETLRLYTDGLDTTIFGNHTAADIPGVILNTLRSRSLAYDPDPNSENPSTNRPRGNIDQLIENDIRASVNDFLARESVVRDDARNAQFNRFQYEVMSLLSLAQETIDACNERFRGDLSRCTANAIASDTINAVEGLSLSSSEVPPIESLQDNVNSLLAFFRPEVNRERNGNIDFDDAYDPYPYSSVQGVRMETTDCQVRTERGGTGERDAQFYGITLRNGFQGIPFQDSHWGFQCEDENGRKISHWINTDNTQWCLWGQADYSSEPCIDRLGIAQTYDIRGDEPYHDVRIDFAESKMIMNRGGVDYGVIHHVPRDPTRGHFSFVRINNLDEYTDDRSNEFLTENDYMEIMNNTDTSIATTFFSRINSEARSEGIVGTGDIELTAHEFHLDHRTEIECHLHQNNWGNVPDPKPFRAEPFICGRAGPVDDAPVDDAPVDDPLPTPASLGAAACSNTEQDGMQLSLAGMIGLTPDQKIRCNDQIASVYQTIDQSSINATTINLNNGQLTDGSPIALRAGETITCQLLNSDDSEVQGASVTATCPALTPVQNDQDDEEESEPTSITATCSSDNDIRTLTFASGIPAAATANDSELEIKCGDGPTQSRVGIFTPLSTTNFNASLNIPLTDSTSPLTSCGIYFEDNQLSIIEDITSCPPVSRPAEDLSGATSELPAKSASCRNLENGEKVITIDALVADGTNPENLSIRCGEGSSVTDIGTVVQRDSEDIWTSTISSEISNETLASCSVYAGDVVYRGLDIGQCNDPNRRLSGGITLGYGYTPVNDDGASIDEDGGIVFDPDSIGGNGVTETTPISGSGLTDGGPTTGGDTNGGLTITSGRPSDDGDDDDVDDEDADDEDADDEEGGSGEEVTTDNSHDDAKCEGYLFDGSENISATARIARVEGDPSQHYYFYTYKNKFENAPSNISEHLNIHREGEDGYVDGGCTAIEGDTPAEASDDNPAFASVYTEERDNDCYYHQNDDGTLQVYYRQPFTPEPGTAQDSIEIPGLGVHFTGLEHPGQAEEEPTQYNCTYNIEGASTTAPGDQTGNTPQGNIACINGTMRGDEVDVNSYVTEAAEGDGEPFIRWLDLGPQQIQEMSRVSSQVSDPSDETLQRIMRGYLVNEALHASNRQARSCAQSPEEMAAAGAENCQDGASSFICRPHSCGGTTPIPVVMRRKADGTTEFLGLPMGASTAGAGVSTICNIPVVDNGQPLGSYSPGPRFRRMIGRISSSGGVFSRGVR